jgi:predicted DNA-binding transcriptional regulator
MVCAGYASQDQIFAAMQNKFNETVRKLFSWEDGFFHYEPGELTPDGCIPVNMNLENLIVEGSRRQHELEELEAEIPSLEMALKFTDRPGTEMNNINLSVEEWRVINFINPKNSIQQIAEAVQMSELEIRRVVYTLLQAGLVEIVRPGGLPLRLPGKMFPTQNPDEQISLVNRLIHRIRSI